MDSVDDETPPDVSVVVPAYNAAMTIDQQLEALASQHFSGPWELVVVENGSSDGTRAAIDAWQDRIAGLRRITSTAPGAGRARNLGVRASRAPIVLLCDADDVVAADWISEMTRALENLSLVGGPIEFEQLNASSLPRPDVEIGAHLPVVFGLPYAVSANMGFRREVFESLGGFDESIPVGEDIDFGWRAHLAGVSMGSAPSAIVHYRLRHTLHSFVRQQYRYAKGHAHVFAKRGGAERGPTRTRRRQLKAFAGDLADLVRRVPTVFRARGRWELSGRVAWVAGAVVGRFRYGVYL